MILIDTDHLTFLIRGEGTRQEILSQRLGKVTDESIALTVVSIEEQLKGWLAAISKAKEVGLQVEPYGRLQGFVRYLNKWTIIPFDEHAAEAFTRFRKQKIRIGTQDLKIASIAVTNDALLLSANLKDFEKVPGLRVENWLR